MTTIEITAGEALILDRLHAGVAIRFTGNGFNHSTVTKAGTFQGRGYNGENGWYTQRNNSLMPQDAVESLIEKGLINVHFVEVGGILVRENTLVLADVGARVGRI